jgi:hypothetical protein
VERLASYQTLGLAEARSREIGSLAGVDVQFARQPGHRVALFMTSL